MSRCTGVLDIERTKYTRKKGLVRAYEIPPCEHFVKEGDSYYCLNGKRRKIASLSNYTGTTPRWCPERRGNGEEA